MSINWYALVRGPLLTVVLIVVAGLHIYRVVQFFRATIPLPDRISPKLKTKPHQPERVRKRVRELASFIRASLHKFRINIRNTIFGMSPVAIWTTTVYHLVIFAALFFVEGHNVLLDLSWGVSLPSLPEGFMNVLTMIFLGITVFYLIRRGVQGSFRFPVIINDYLSLLITAAPFATGLIAYQQWLDYNTVIILHMLSGQLFFLMLPFSKMGHLIYFIFGRFFLDGELNLGRGRRVWKNDFPIEVLPPSSSADSGDVDVDYIRYMLKHKKTQMKVMMTFCSRCSNCARSCFLYNQTGDPSYIPSHKVFNSIGKLYRKRGSVSHAELEEIGDTVWNKCVLCERCYCPVGLKIADMIAFGRSICRSQGVYRKYDSFDD